MNVKICNFVEFTTVLEANPKRTFEQLGVNLFSDAQIKQEKANPVINPL